MPAAHTVSRRLRLVGAATCLALLVTACGDDDDTDASAADDTTFTDGQAAEGSVADYCAAIAEMEEADAFDAAQFERIKETAPEEISEEIDFVADAFIAAEGDVGKVFADPEVEEKLGPIEAFEAEHCEGEDPDAGDELAIAPENQEYCRLSLELEEQPGPPTVEQIEALRDAAPAEIQDEADIVLEAFRAADGDVGKAFADPAVEDAIGPIEDFDAEACGMGGDDADEDDEEDEAATEPLEGAAIVPVTAVDFAFEGIPATLAAGPTSFELTNEGESAHEMGLARLGEGVDLDELLARGEEPSPEEAEELGFTFAEPGGDSTYLNVEDLEPGRYAVVCFIPGPGGKAHHELGMKTTFTVS